LNFDTREKNAQQIQIIIPACGRRINMKDLCGIYFSIQAALFPMPKEEKIENSGKNEFDAAAGRRQRPARAAVRRNMISETRRLTAG